MTPNRTVLPCPGCQRPVGLPPEALGKPVNCPHCAATFHVPLGPDGTPGDVTLGAPQVAATVGLPRGFVVPVLALLMLGFAGVVVDGYLSYRFATQPNAEYQYAYGRAIEARSILSSGDTSSMASDRWEHLAPASVAGCALTISAGEVLEDDANAKLAAAWQSSVAPASHYSVVASALAALGGVCILRGRYYWLAFAGCVAAIVNVNHLCCIPGGVAGVWGILSLVRDEGRAHFRILPSGRR